MYAYMCVFVLYMYICVCVYVHLYMCMCYIYVCVCVCCTCVCVLHVCVCVCGTDFFLNFFILKFNFHILMAYLLAFSHVNESQCSLEEHSSLCFGIFRVSCPGAPVFSSWTISTPGILCQMPHEPHHWGHLLWLCGTTTFNGTVE